MKCADCGAEQPLGSPTFASTEAGDAWVCPACTKKRQLARAFGASWSVDPSAADAADASEVRRTAETRAIVERLDELVRLNRRIAWHVAGLWWFFWGPAIVALGVLVLAIVTRLLALR
jgi:hypothetical protein